MENATGPHIIATIGPQESLVLSYLRDRGNNWIDESSIKIDTLDSREISSAVSWLEKKGLIDVRREDRTTFELGEEGKRYLEIGLPELRILRLFPESGSISLDELGEKFDRSEIGIALTQLSKFGIKPGKNGIIEIPKDRMELILLELEMRQQKLSDIANSSQQADDQVMQSLLKRSGVVVSKRKLVRLIRINDRGLKTVERGIAGGTIGRLTPDIIKGGNWQKESFRAYDLNAPVPAVTTAVAHPLRQLIDIIREIFLSFGFREMSGHYIETAFWNMDALFIPQDHPARDLQDTFFLEGPEMEIEHQEVIDSVRRSHEKGIRRYRGWEYKWSMDKAKQPLLRTHTTVSTIRTLYELKECPVALFSIEKVFRHESVDWKHLAELHQIEGAYYASDANLSTLKWLMTEFYSRLGFDDIRLVPSYYPYTEPSMDVVAYINGREIELGGSGIFRPEVTIPLGLKEPVIAWGLGLERLAMIFYGLDDIRRIYSSDLNWLRSFTLKMRMER